MTATAVPPATTFAPTDPPTNVLSTSACIAWHTVQPSERLFRIGQQYGVDWREIARVNNIADPGLIYAGQGLCIPAAGAIVTLPATTALLKPPPPTSTTTHAPPALSPTALPCQFAWFFSSQPQQGCPRASPLQSFAAAQSFEHGTMIWVKQLGRYFLLSNTILFEGDARKRLDYVHDPLDIIRDTSAEIILPAGLYVPVSGFGLIWRGDVSQSAGYREVLGWALAPEFGYDTMYQCDDARPSGGYNWNFCYLRGPGGEVSVLHPQGGWYLLGERGTSVRLIYAL